MTDIFFKSPAHKQRFLAAVQDKVYDGRMDPEYGAALYVLTADLSTWNRVQEYVTHDGIDFEAMLQEQDWSGGYRVLIQWAANLFNGLAAHCGPVELMRLDEANFEVVLAALKIRRYGMQVKSI